MTLENALKLLELNPRNVVGVIQQCKATPETKKVYNANFYSKDSRQQAPVYPLDVDRLLQYRSLIKYWLGQLQFVQQQEETVSPAMGLINYQGKRWTEDNRALFALYYLATSLLLIPSFRDRELPNARTYYKTLPATYAPSDPSFKITEPVEEALFSVGCFDTQKETIAAAKRGNADAQYKLAYMLHHWGHREEAWGWYEKAAMQGNTEAMWALSSHNEENSKPVREQKWRMKAAELGDYLAQSFLADAYLMEGKDMSRAIYWYEKAAEQGYEHALRKLMKIYMYGRDGVSKNLAVAARWGAKLCELYDRDRKELSELAEQALQLQKNKSYALGYQIMRPIAEYAYKTQDKDFAVACASVGVSYAYGTGVARDRYEAKKWLQRALDMGYEKARQELRKL